MNTGMLWLDDDKKRPFDEKVRRAAVYYQDKYGRLPNVCFVSRKATKEATQVDKISIVPDRAMQPHHFWLGLNNA